jgi:hypothetical protein
MDPVMTTSAQADEMRHRIDTRPPVMPDELLAIHFAANPAAEPITAQDVIEQAAEAFARVPLPPITTGAQTAAYGFGTATAK